MGEIPTPVDIAPGFSSKGESPREEGYYFGELKEFERAFTALVGKLRCKIDRGTYDLLISDEVGGRLPTLALREVIKRRRGKAPRTVFMPKPSDIFANDPADARMQLRKRVPEGTPVKRALVVSEYAHLGTSLRWFASLLGREGIEADFAVGSCGTDSRKLEEDIGIAYRWDGRRDTGLRRLIPRKEPELIVGFTTTSYDIPKLDMRAGMLSGVIREPQAEFGISRFKESGRKDINLSRVDVKAMAQRAIEKVWG